MVEVSNTVTLDTCAPDAGCSGVVSIVALQAPGLSFAIPKGAFVTVQVERSWGFGYCPTWVSIVNEPTWGGEPNPVSKEPLVYFLGTEQRLENPAAPFAVTKEPVSCPDSVSHYELVFAGSDGVSQSLAMGQEATVLGPAPFLVRNQRSYQLNAADAPAEISWWAVAAALVK